MKAIYFDMDGTIADLYGYEGWERLLREEDITPYQDCKPLVNMKELNDILMQFVNFGIIIGVISWGAMNCSKEYTRRTKKVKVAWCEQYLTCITEYHVVKYGTPKHWVRKEGDSILVDDNAEVRAAWRGETIDASCPYKMIEQLKQLLKEIT